MILTAAVSAGLTLAAARILGTRTSPPRVEPSGPVAVVVQNKVAVGTKLIEDSTPIYLSSRPVPYCSRQGCKLEGTDMWSGTIVSVTCQISGAWMTNEDLASVGVAHNPGRAASSIWYRATLPDRRTGYISEVYLQAQYRGGMNLHRCH